jgi:hypothetical protein
MLSVGVCFRGQELRGLELTMDAELTAGVNWSITLYTHIHITENGCTAAMRATPTLATGTSSHLY